MQRKFLKKKANCRSRFKEVIMGEKITQEDKIYSYIKNNGSITNRQATIELGIGRLASRVSDMKKAGIDIRKVMHRVKNSDESHSYVAFYYIGDNKPVFDEDE